MLKVHRLCFPTSNHLEIWLISFPTSNRLDIFLKVDTRPFVDGKSAIGPFLGGRALLIPSPNLGKGIPLPIFQFWCGDFIPPPDFLKLHLVRGFYLKLVRGEQSKMRGSNTEIVCQRARAARRCSAAPLKRFVLWLLCQARRIQKTSLYAHPGLSYIAVTHRRPRPLNSDSSRAMYARQVTSWVRLGSQW